MRWRTLVIGLAGLVQVAAPATEARSAQAAVDAATPCETIVSQGVV